MTSSGFLSTASVVSLLVAVALLAVGSALTLAPFDKFDRPRAMRFLVCLAGIWAGADLVIWLIRRTI
jgi:hypothetical protein